MGHLVCPEEDAEGITCFTDRGDRGSEEGRESKKREEDIIVGDERKEEIRKEQRERLENWNGMETEKGEKGDERRGRKKTCFTMKMMECVPAPELWSIGCLLLSSSETKRKKRQKK